MKRILLVILVLGMAAGCHRELEKKMDSDREFLNNRVTVIDGCQYLEFSYGVGWREGIYSITHKGNCTNSIHKY